MLTLLITVIYRGKWNLIWYTSRQSNGLTWIFRRMEEIIKQFISIITYQFIKSIQIKQQNFSLPLLEHKFFYFFPIFFNTKCNSTYIIIVSRINPITNNKTPNYLRQIIFEIVLQSTHYFQSENYRCYLEFWNFYLPIIHRIYNIHSPRCFSGSCSTMKAGTAVTIW